MSIFINYRKDDSRWNTQALYNGLLKYFPKEAIFKDFNNIQPGDEFVDSIYAALEQCNVLLVVISKDWLNATGADGKKRLDDPGDFVRIEIATALKRKIRVIPVLFDNIEMPKENALPEELQPLTRRQFISISDTRFDTDLQKLTEAIRRKQDETTVLQSIVHDPEPVHDQIQVTTEIPVRSRIISALKACLIASIAPLLLLIFKPTIETEQFFSYSLSETILFSFGLSGIPWAVVGSIAATNRKKWTGIFIISILVLLSMIIMSIVNKEDFGVFIGIFISFYAALISLLVLFFAWLFKKFSN